MTRKAESSCIKWQLSVQRVNIYIEEEQTVTNTSRKVQNDNMSANTLVYRAESESNGMKKTFNHISLSWSQGDRAV